MRNTLLIFTLIMFSCGQYQKILNSSDIDYKYENALKYYDKGDFARAMPIFKELSTMLRATKRAEEVNYYLAYCHYNSGDLLTSSYLFRLYARTYPNGSHVEECAYMSAYCVYLESPSYKLDDTYTKKAISELRQFIDQYPSSSKVEKCYELIDDLNDKLALKAFENAKQYYTTEFYQAAIVDLNNVLIDFPSSNNREEIHFLILKSTYNLALNSISSKVEERLNNTIDAFMVFSDNYPKSQYYKEADLIKQQAEKILKQLN